MFDKWLNARRKRKLDIEFMHLELAEQEAHAKAELMVVSAERALADAEVKAQRIRDDALMEKRWESIRLNIVAKYLEREDQVQERPSVEGRSFPMEANLVVQPHDLHDALGKAVVHTFGGKQAEEIVSRKNPLADKFKKGK